MKICKSCFIEKEINEFNVRRNHCKVCMKIKRVENSYLKKEHYLKNFEKIKIKKEAYKQKDPNRWKNYRRDYVLNRLKNDPIYKLRFSLRSRLRVAIGGNYKSGSAVRDLGCSIEELKLYLESKFQPGMTWENHGKWHIDHVIPLSMFDLTIRDQLLKACHYSNLQPLWAKDNIIKSNKVSQVDIITKDGDLR